MLLANVRKNRDGQYLLSRIAARLIAANAVDATEQDHENYLAAWSIVYDLSAAMDVENGLEKGTSFALFHAAHWPKKN